MKQMKLFGAHDDDVQKRSVWKLYTDGAARNNPGPAGAGVYLLKDKKPIIKKGHFLKSRTNNQAEYLALLLGIFYAKDRVDPKDTLHVIADSQLLVRQMTGHYRVRNPELKRLQRAAFMLLKSFSYTMRHVLREDNVHADELANEGIDKKVEVPEAFLVMLREYDVPW